MPIVDRVAAFAQDVTGWRRRLHQDPELDYDVHRTAAFVAEKLRGFGCDEVVTGLGRTGVVGVIRGRAGKGAGASSGRTIGLRADMDALPILEATGLPYASTTPGCMHACGHDGHTAMLLGAARYLCETRNFAGSAAMIFQPAEEGGGGGKAMLEDGLIERFGLAEFYGMHTWPGLPAGQFAIRPGPMSAAADRFDVDIEGVGGHAAFPHLCRDPVVAAAAIVTALQAIVSRDTDPVEACVVSVTRFQAGDAYNVIPNRVRIGGTMRALSDAVRARTRSRVEAVATSVALAYGTKATVVLMPGYPVNVNEAACAGFAAEVAREVVGDNNVEAACPPSMGAEDFAYMLQARPGAYILIGNGESAGLHNPRFDFNDETAPAGVSYWARLVEKRLA